MQRLIYISLLFLLAGASCIYATPEFAPAPAPLAGTVLYKSSGLPVVGVVVAVNNGLIHSSTDAQGQFAFHDIGPGEYALTVYHLGYETEERIIRIAEGDTHRILISLNSLAISLEPVLLEASNSEQIYRITEQDIHTRNWSGVADAIRSLPGVQVYEQGGAGSRATVSLRGSRPDHVVVEVDGVPMNNGAGEAVDISTIPLNAIHSIAVDPSSQPGAPGGRILINTVPLRSSSRSKWTAQIEGQSPQALIGTISASRPTVNDGHYSLTANYVSNDGEYDYSDEFGETVARINNDRNRLTLSAAGDLPVANLKLEGSGGFTVLDAGSPSPLYQPPTPEARLNETSWRAQFRLQPVNPGSKMGQLMLFANGSERSFVNPREQFNPATQQTVIHTPVDINDQSIRGGIRYSHHLSLFERGAWSSHADLIAEGNLESFESVDQLGTGTVSRTGGEIHRAALAQETHLTARWQGKHVKLRTQLDGRVDQVHDAVDAYAPAWSDDSDTHFSGRARILAAPSEGRWSVELGSGSAIALPSFTHRFLVESVFALGNPDLESERVSDLHAGLNWVQTLPQHASISATLHGFLRRTSNLIIWQRNWRGQYFPDNFAEATAHGFESAVALHSNTRLEEMQASLTWQHVVNTSPGSPYEGNRVPFQPDLYGNLSLRVNILASVYILGDINVNMFLYTNKSPNAK